MAYFPFDPYILAESASFIEPLYYTWQAPEQGDDDDNTDTDGDRSQTETGESEGEWLCAISSKQCFTYKTYILTLLA